MNPLIKTTLILLLTFNACICESGFAAKGVYRGKPRTIGESSVDGHSPGVRTSRVSIPKPVDITIAKGDSYSGSGPTTGGTVLLKRREMIVSKDIGRVVTAPAPKIGLKPKEPSETLPERVEKPAAAPADIIAPIKMPQISAAGKRELARRGEDESLYIERAEFTERYIDEDRTEFLRRIESNKQELERRKRVNDQNLRRLMQRSFATLDDTFQAQTTGIYSPIAQSLQRGELYRRFGSIESEYQVAYRKGMEKLLNLERDVNKTMERLKIQLFEDVKRGATKTMDSYSTLSTQFRMALQQDMDVIMG